MEAAHTHAIDREIAEAGAYWDGRAPGYPDAWVPVLRPPGLELLDAVAAALRWDRRDAHPDAGADLLDVGTGPGTLPIDAALRWPGIRATGLDVSPAMLEFAAAAADLAAGERSRLRWVRGSAVALPFPDASYDAVVSAFTFQFIPRQQQALREFHRVLRPGGVLAWVTWRAGSPGPFAPDGALEEELKRLGRPLIDPPPSYRRKPPSPAAAAQQARRAGFRRVTATARDLVYGFGREEYLRLVEFADAPATFRQFAPDERDRFRRAVLGRWKALPDAAFVMRERLVQVVGRR